MKGTDKMKNFDEGYQGEIDDKQFQMKSVENSIHIKELKEIVNAYAKEQYDITESINQYIKLLIRELVVEYNLSQPEAEKAVYSSAVNKMLYTEKERQWQMHQPLNATLEEIYCEYKGFPISL